MKSWSVNLKLQVSICNLLVKHTAENLKMKSTPLPSTPLSLLACHSFLCFAALCPINAPEVSCLVDPCRVRICRTFPTAQCRSNMCGGCNAHFFINNRLVDCSKFNCSDMSPYLLVPWSVAQLVFLNVPSVLRVSTCQLEWSMDDVGRWWYSPATTLILVWPWTCVYAQRDY